MNMDDSVVGGGGTEIIIEDSALSSVTRNGSVIESQQLCPSRIRGIEDVKEEEVLEEQEDQEQVEVQSEEEDKETEEDDEEEDGSSEEEVEEEELEIFKRSKKFTNQTGTKLTCILPSRIWRTGALIKVTLKINHKSERIIKAVQLYLRTTYSFASLDSHSFYCGLLTYNDSNCFPINAPTKYEAKIEYTIPQALVQPTSDAFVDFYEQNIKEMYSNKNNKTHGSKMITSNNNLTTKLDDNNNKKSNKIIGYYNHLIVDLLVKRPFGCERISLEIPVHINYEQIEMEKEQDTIEE